MMRFFLLLALLASALWADGAIEANGLKLQIDPLGPDRGRFQLVIGADQARQLADELELRVGEGEQEQTIILRREMDRTGEPVGDRLYEAVDFLPENPAQPYYLRGLYGKNDDTAVMIRLILFRW